MNGLYPNLEIESRLRLQSIAVYYRWSRSLGLADSSKIHRRSVLWIEFGVSLVSDLNLSAHSDRKIAVGVLFLRESASGALPTRFVSLSIYPNTNIVLGIQQRVCNVFS